MAGHLRKRNYGNGRVRWRARYPDPTRGGTSQIERTFDTKREAERWLTEQKASVNRGLHINPADSDRRLCDVVAEWRGTWGHLQPRTKAGYEGILNKHVLPRWGNARVGAISAAVVQDWVNELAASGRAPATLRRVYGVLQSVLKLAVQRRYITVNPCESVQLPRKDSFARDHQPAEMLFLTAAEVQALADAITPQHRVLIWTAAYTGMRAGELYGLQRKHIDVLHGRIRVERALKEVSTTSKHIAADERGMVFGTTKSGKARWVGLPRFLVELLTERLAALPADPDTLVFGGKDGKPKRHGDFYRRHFKPAVRRRYCEACQARVPAEAGSCPECGGSDLRWVLPPAKHGLRFHDLRHTCAALLIAADVHPKAIQEHLGHADIQTTFNVYGHLLPEAREALAAALDATYTSGQTEPHKVAQLRGS
jgi:integrase